jgi:3-oxoacyl-(acyl-carrier-protein) synthase
LLCRVKLDAGLDEDHETAAANGPAGSQARRHALETWDRIEGQAELAERNAHANDDGHIDKEEAKAIKKANKRQDRNHQRGVHSFKPFR